MTEDQLSYKRATSVALIGLAIQLAVAIVLLLYARFGQDIGAMTGFWFVFLGVPVWLALALVFHQHRLERIEALEAEAYRASSAAEASVFEGGGSEELVHAHKLAWMHKWFLPGVSVVLGVSYVLLGLFRYVDKRDFTRIDEFVPPVHTGWAISVCAGIAVIGFVFARFVAGMAKQSVWSLLHAGSGAAVGSALVGFILALAHFLQTAIGYDLLLRYMPTILAFAMVALGVEIFLNFVLNLYRPRRAGEFQRPAFDSRILAFVAAPDKLAESISEAINYQFGFNVSSTWFYKLLQRSAIGLGALAVLLVWGMSCFAIVEPHEKGLLIRGGKLDKELESGLILKGPWPFARVEKFPARAVNEIIVGAPKPTEGGPILWTNKHAGDESMFLVQPTPDASGMEAQQSDYSLLVAAFPIHFTVSDLVQYVGLAQDARSGNPDRFRHDLLKARASGVIMEYMATLNVNEILGDARARMSEDIRTQVQAAFNDMNAGVTVLYAGVAEVHPNDEVAKSFEAVVDADQKRITEIERARSEEITLLAETAGSVDAANEILAGLDELDSMRGRAERADVVRAEQALLDTIASNGGQAGDIVSRARTERWDRHMSARATLVESTGRVAAYRAAPIPYLTSQWLDAMTDVSSNARVFIVPRDSIRIDVEYEEIEPLIGDFSTAGDSLPGQ